MPTKEFNIKNKWLDIDSDNFKVRLDGVDVYQVKGNGFSSCGSQASFQTMDGNELAVLQQKKDTEKAVPWKIFEWMKDGKVWATATQSRSYWGTFDKKLISVDIPGENDYTITGDRLAMKFEIFIGGEKVGDIEKKWTLIDQYNVSVLDGADEVDVLMCGILINYVYHTHDSNRKPPKFDRCSFESTGSTGSKK